MTGVQRTWEGRREIRSLLTGPAGTMELARLADARSAGVEPDPRPLYRLLGRHGLLAPCWPSRYGGRAAPPVAIADLVTELVAAGVPETLHTLSVQICGNFLLRAGSPAQRATILPALASGAKYCAVLYSEPEAGSDLAALTTTAEPDPDGGWLLTGRKVYSVRVGLADLGLVAARTGAGASRYQGISLFLVDLTAPGVLVKVLPSIAEEDFADVALVQVPVPAEALIGPAGGAWPLITDVLALERVGIDHVAKAERWLSIAASPADVRDGRAVQVGELRTRTAAARAMALDCLDRAAAGELDLVRAAGTKLWCSETAREVAWWAVEDGATDQAGPDAAVLAAAYREAPGLTISAGTSEMMLELVSSSGLAGPDQPPDDEGEVTRQLRAAVRATVAGTDEADPLDDWWLPLAELGVFKLGVPLARGGLELGTEAVLAVCDELGREPLDGGLLTTMTAIDVLVATGPAETGPLLEAALAGAWRALPDGSERPGAATLLDLGDALLVRTAEGSELARCDGPEARTVRAAGRYRMAAWIGGLGAAAVARTVRRVGEREQFGRPVGANQAVGFELARLTVRYQALRALLSSRAERSVALAAGALAEAQRFALAATRTAMQLHGAYGMTADSPVARYYQRAPAAVEAAGAPAGHYRLAADGVGR